MNILAIEFSSPRRSVAVVQTQAGHGVPSAVEAVQSGDVPTAALALVDEALKRAGMEREQMDCVAVGLGPGSYTGIRAAIALAQGWQLARAVKILGTSSAECIAEQARMEGLSGRVSVVIDAQREEFCVEDYELSAGECRRLDRLRLASLAQVREHQAAGKILIGPEVARWFSGSQTVFPTALLLGKLAMTRNDFVAGENLIPIYLRETAFSKAPPARHPGRSS